MRILAIETSCDETSIAVVEDRNSIILDLIASQVKVHEKFGGVVPELAARHHVYNMKYMLSETFSKVDPDSIDAVAVTYGPGLVGALLVGISVAKGIALSLKKPLIGVNHLLGHIHSVFLAFEDLQPPLIVLIASGGHTEIVHVKTHTEVEVLGRTLDDAAGEAFDKVARILGLGYPGGPAIDKAAKEGNPNAINFPRPMKDLKNYDFSFAGLKTSVLYYLERNKDVSIPDVAASFQEAIVDVLIDKTFRAARNLGIRKLAIVGGVSANTHLRERAQMQAEKWGYQFYSPPLRFCTDNAAMIARAAFDLYEEGKLSGMDLNAVPYLTL